MPKIPEKFMGLLGKFADSLDYKDLPRGWADNPKIVNAAEELYRNMGTKSPFFKAWEKKLGAAEKAYHGGSGKIEDFSRGPQRGYLGQAYFNTDPNVARKYALLGGVDDSLENVSDYVTEYNFNKSTLGRKPTVTSAYIAQKNPSGVEVNFDEAVDLLPFKSFRPAMGEELALNDYAVNKNGLKKYFWDNLNDLPDEEWANTVGHDFTSLYGEANPGFFSLLNSGTLPDYLKKKGSNAIRYNDQEAGGVTIVPQTANQIKSTSNRGTFNPADPNIYRSAGPLAVGAGAGAAAMGASDAQASAPYSIPSDIQAQWNSFRQSGKLPEKPLEAPVWSPADMMVAPVGAATTAGKVAAVAADPLMAYGADKLGGLLGYFWGD